MSYLLKWPIFLRGSFSQMELPAELSVVTFGSDTQAGLPARQFYERMGFHAAEDAPRGPEGGSRQVYRRIFSALERRFS